MTSVMALEPLLDDFSRGWLVASTMQLIGTNYENVGREKSSSKVNKMSSVKGWAESAFRANLDVPRWSSKVAWESALWVQETA